MEWAAKQHGSGSDHLEKVDLGKGTVADAGLTEKGVSEARRFSKTHRTE